MKKLVLLPLVIVLVAGLVLASCAEPTPSPSPSPAPSPSPSPSPSPTPPPQEPITLKMVSFKPDVPPDQFFEHGLMDRVYEKTNGLITIEWVGGTEAIPPTDAPAAVASGSMDIVSALFGYMDTLVPGWECMGNTAMSIPELRASPVWDFSVNLFKEKNIHYMGSSTPSEPQRMMAIYSKEKIATLSDFEGVKFATQGPAYVAMLTALGAQPAIIPMPDYFTAMERGTVDAFHIGCPGVINWGCKEVTNYMLDELHGDSSSAFLMNLDVWNSLSKDLQDAVTAAVIENEVEGAKLWEGVIDGVKQELTEAGVEIVKFSPEDSQKFHEIYMEATWSVPEGKNPERVAQFKELLYGK
jgi:TRAP-type C4-dicarboxylate transport system substrate-binding protein